MYFIETHLRTVHEKVFETYNHEIKEIINVVSITFPPVSKISTVIIASVKEKTPLGFLIQTN